eukprot:2190050-Pyramimonas_sp.AAC.1
MCIRDSPKIIASCRLRMHIEHPPWPHEFFGADRFVIHGAKRHQFLRESEAFVKQRIGDHVQSGAWAIGNYVLGLAWPGELCVYNREPSGCKETPGEEHNPR